MAQFYVTSDNGSTATLTTISGADASQDAQVSLGSYVPVGIAKHPSTGILYSVMTSGSGNLPNYLVSIDPTTGEVTSLFDTGVTVTEGDVDFEASTNELMLGSARLYRIGLTSGVVTDISGGDLADTIDGLSYNPANGNLYATIRRAGGMFIRRMNISTGQFDTLQAINGVTVESDTSAGLEFDKNGNAYFAYDGKLYTFSVPSNGDVAATFIGNTGLTTTNASSGLTFKGNQGATTSFDFSGFAVDPAYLPFDPAYFDEYLAKHGGVVYYVQNKPGSGWFDNVSNENGWTIDFNLDVLTSEDANVTLLDSEAPSGAGIYVNDGVRQESIYFLSQEIVFKHAKFSVVYDTTFPTTYRLVGKNDNLKLYARRDSEVDWTLIADVKNFTEATNSRNSKGPSAFQDSSGNIHAAWSDDGNISGRIYYAKWDGAKWSVPEQVTSSNFGSTNPNIIGDATGHIYIFYEDASTDYTSVAMVYLNGGSNDKPNWGEPALISPGPFQSRYPSAAVDSENNIHVVWEDGRFGHSEVMYSRWDRTTLSFSSPVRVTDTENGCARPVIDTYLSKAFVAYTCFDNAGSSDIHIKNLFMGSGAWSESLQVSGDDSQHADYPDIVAGFDGTMHVVYHDDKRANSFDIYAAQVSPTLNIKQGEVQVSATLKDSSFPSASIQDTTGDIYVAWHDTRLNANDVNRTVDAYFLDVYRVDARPTIRVAHYDVSTSTWLSSGQGSYDVLLEAEDQRSMRFAALPKEFSGDVHVLYESEMARDNEYVIDSKEHFTEIRDAVYDLSRPMAFQLVRSEYLDTDQLVSTPTRRRELRFGDFSGTIGSSLRFKHFRYYLGSGIPPFKLLEISSNTLPIDDLSVQDVAINNYGDAWIATPCGMYFYSNIQNSVAKLTDTDVDDEDLRSIAFDKNNRLFVGAGSKVSYSFDHLNFTAFSQTESGAVTDIAFTPTNRMVVATQSGATIYEIKESPIEPTESSIHPTPSSLSLAATSKATFASGEYVSAVEVDSLGVVWASTRNGLYRYFKGNETRFSTVNGLPTNYIGGLSIRNTAIRYLATAAGLVKMVGSSFERYSSETGDISNNNVKDVLWQEPDTVWASTLSKISQIREHRDGSRTSTFYGPESYSTYESSANDFKTFFIVVESGDAVPTTAAVEVYLNGNRIYHGFNVSVSNSTQRLVQFETELLDDDVIDVVVRSDLNLLTSFSQTEAERNALGRNVIRVRDIQAVNGEIYLSTDGDNRELKLNDDRSPVPHDCVQLDTGAPEGCISITEQIDSSTVRVSISDTSDGDDGSGIESMVVSNFPNFTTDGSTPQSAIPFSASAVHSIGLLGGSTSESLEFSSANGNMIHFFDNEQEMYAGTYDEPKLYKLDNATGEWSVVASYGTTGYVDFVARFNNKFIVGVGSDTVAGRVYIYSDDGLFASPVVRAISGNRFYDAQEFLNTLYIATGADGKVYSTDGDTLSVAFTGLSTNVYSLGSTSTALYAGAGEDGRIYRLDPSEGVSMVSHQDSDSGITSMESATINGTDLLFAGTATQGKILRTFFTEDSFNVSFNTTDAEVSALKSFDGTLYAAIGRSVYSIDDSAVWTWRASWPSAITDLAVFSDDVYALTSDSVVKVISSTESRTIYLKLIDRAGNESALFNDSGDLIDCRYASIEISDLQGVVSENRILELDEYGSVVYSLGGPDKFFSAQKSETEQGVYYSQVFNGTNDIIKWDDLTWISNEPEDTAILMYVRSSVSATDILSEEWVGPFTAVDSSGLDISSFTGQFIQFRAVLQSSRKDITPSLSRVVLSTITSESIHFFTTNFVLPSRVRKGILTSTKIVPIAADVVFGINTTDSVNWSDYQIVDENRLFNVDQFGTGLRVGIKLISPSRSTLSPAEFSEYGPYNSSLFINAVDFDFYNAGPSSTFDFRVTFYDDVNLTMQAYQISSEDSPDSFSVDNEDISSSGKTVGSEATVSVLLDPPGDANLQCNAFYFVKIEAYDQDLEAYEIVSDTQSFIAGCSASFIDTIEFDFENTTGATEDFHFRVRFYSDGERTDLYRTEFSGNNRTGWLANSSEMPEGGFEVDDAETATLSFTPDPDNFEPNTLYYLIIDAYDGTNFLRASNSYTFVANDSTSLEYCGPYMDVPIVKNLALMFETVNNDLLTLNL